MGPPSDLSFVPYMLNRLFHSSVQSASGTDWGPRAWAGHKARQVCGITKFVANGLTVAFSSVSDHSRYKSAIWTAFGDRYDPYFGTFWNSIAAPPPPPPSEPPPPSPPPPSPPPPFAPPSRPPGLPPSPPPSRPPFQPPPSPYPPPSPLPPNEDMVALGELTADVQAAQQQADSILQIEARCAVLFECPSLRTMYLIYSVHSRGAPACWTHTNGRGSLPSTCR